MVRNIIIAFVSLMSVQLFAAPILQMDFNDAAGNQSLENRGTWNVTGTFGGNAAYTTDAAPPNTGGFACSFDGSTGGAQFGDLNGLDGKNTATMTAWVNLDSSPSDTRRIVSNQDNTDSSREGIELAITSGNNLQVIRGLNGGNDDQVTSTASISQDTWTFVAAVFSNGKDVDFYTSTTAGSVGTADSDSMTATNAIQASTEDFYIGRRPDSDERVFPGLIDNVRIYDTALTQAELNTISSFNDPIPEPASGLLLLLGLTALLPRRGRREA